MLLDDSEEEGFDGEHPPLMHAEYVVALAVKPARQFPLVLHPPFVPSGFAQQYQVLEDDPVTAPRIMEKDSFCLTNTTATTSITTATTTAIFLSINYLGEITQKL